MHYFPHIHLSPPSSRVSSSSLLLRLRGCAASLPPGLAAVGRWSVLVPGLRVCLAGASAAASSPPSSPAPNRGCHPRPLRGFRFRPIRLAQSDSLRWDYLSEWAAAGWDGIRGSAGGGGAGYPRFGARAVAGRPR